MVTFEGKVACITPFGFYPASPRGPGPGPAGMGKPAKLLLHWQAAGQAVAAQTVTASERPGRVAESMSDSDGVPAQQSTELQLASGTPGPGLEPGPSVSPTRPGGVPSPRSRVRPGLPAGAQRREMTFDASSG